MSIDDNNIEDMDVKYKEPTKGKTFRDLFKRNGYKVYLIDEYNTSKKLYKIGHELKNFITRKTPRPYRTGKRIVHGLLRSKNVNISKPMEGLLKGKFIGQIVNRDTNASLNIRLKACCIINKRKIPKYLLRAPKREDSVSLK